MTQPPVLELSGISKAFGGVRALRDVDFALKAGEIHGLVGENGAGKSTLMKIIAGVHSEYEGRMRIDGREVRFRSARDALAAGVGMVHQELSIVPDLSVAENVFLGSQPLTKLGIVDWAGMRRAAEEQLRRLGIDLDPRTPAGALPIGLQQLIEIARVLFSGARIIILDEPTSALSPPEIERLFGVLRRLRDEGRSFVFISHFLDDILRISDSVTVFRNGQRVMSAAAAETDKAMLIDRMIGAGHDELEESYTGEFRLDPKPGHPVVLSVDGLSLAGRYRDISLEVRAGEVLGIYGFMGCGQLELARTLFGKLRADGGRVSVAGQPVQLSSTAKARRAGIAFVPESRRAMLFHHEPIYKNVSISILDRISRWLLRPEAERGIARKHVERLRIRTPHVDAELGALSGGNQQKVALAKWLTYAPRVLILSEPTRGMDVGAKEDVVGIVRGLRDQGIGVVVVSAEPETVLALADRILVMRKGQIAREFAEGTVSKDRLLEAA
ncbi:sugar ABC transporter ATP-binding protein [Inquilinus limosus]|uniref:sugar ABC transporter ATP-binding protein n=1 Tax=Inquilinus limosus TaxID=171674 RepID=UPI003F1477ED